MMMATWAAAAMAAAASGTNHPLTDPSVPLNNQTQKLPESQPNSNALKIPYPPAPFPFHPVNPTLPTGSGKFAPRGPVPSDLRHGSAYANILANDIMHTKYPDSSVGSTRGLMNRSMHNHPAPVDFTKVPHPWNWAFGFPPAIPTAPPPPPPPPPPQPAPPTVQAPSPVTSASSSVTRPTSTKGLSDPDNRIGKGRTVENIHPVESMDHSDHDLGTRVPSCPSISSLDAASASPPLDVCNAPDLGQQSSPESNQGRDCLSPLWWINLTQPNRAQEQSHRIPPGRTVEKNGPLNMHMLRLGPGQDLRACLSHYVTSQHLNGAFVVTCCGSVRNARLRLANLEVKEFGGPFEIVSLVGTLDCEGQPHLHIALADSTGAVCGGHLLGPSRIHTTAELVLGVVDFAPTKTVTTSSPSAKELKRPASKMTAEVEGEQPLSLSTSLSPKSPTDHSDVTAASVDARSKTPRLESQLRIRLVRKTDPSTGFKELTVESTGAAV
ncbi:unnamed protein product [Echinostoma caproni]|uniref:PPC domain-containing protein n=1 Tax=Echinostoma caproni TaxID=27848 RepID=A0A183AW58_9TREM|nr:unnamed protein product [Echinostoma caproni]